MRMSFLVQIDLDLSHDSLLFIGVNTEQGNVWTILVFSAFTPRRCYSLGSISQHVQDEYLIKTNLLIGLEIHYVLSLGFSQDLHGSESSPSFHF